MTNKKSLLVIPFAQHIAMQRITEKKDGARMKTGQESALNSLINQFSYNMNHYNIKGYGKKIWDDRIIRIINREGLAPGN